MWNSCCSIYASNVKMAFAIGNASLVKDVEAPPLTGEDVGNGGVGDVNVKVNDGDADTDDEEEEDDDAAVVEVAGTAFGEATGTAALLTPRQCQHNGSLHGEPVVVAT
jgi:hypothetical protein